MAIPANRRAPRTKALVQLEEIVLGALNDMKAVNVRVMDVRGLTDVADTMIIASGNSDRHVRAIADLVIEHAKKAGRRPMGTEGKNDAEWVLVDLQDVLVHVMLPRVREFYALEQLWEAPAASRSEEAGDQGQGKGKGNRGGNGDAPAFSAVDSRMILDYASRHSGLVSPDARRLPPGLEKNLRRGKPLPPGWQKKILAFPTPLEGQLPPLPAGYRRVVVDRWALIVADATNVVWDVIDLIKR